jgi:hypothetical protein
MANLSSPTPTTGRPAMRPWLLVGVSAGVLVALTLGLWAHYGSTVFFEMLAAGLAACF